MRITTRGYVAACALTFMVGLVLPYHLLPWN